ncbi:MAG: ribosome assembly RNA-binding protein YhbY [Thermodesulfobacteriota bacterium]
MEELKGFQKKFLRGLAHGLSPVVLVGAKGLTPALVKALDQALRDHEVIKVKFLDEKEKEGKKALADEICKASQAQLAGMIGHTAVFFRQNQDPEKRKVKLPQRAEADAS